jgi:lipopolysaccharide export system permease protein
MFKLLDRSLIYAYLKSYLVVLVSLIGLFVVVDLFTNLDKFTQNSKGFEKLLEHIGIFYANKLPQIFDHLCEAIVLLAAMFTVALIQRNNELLPLLSAGVSTRRVVRPVLFSAFLVMLTCVANQEFVMPHSDNYIIENPTDFEGKNELSVNGAYDSKNALFMGKSAVRKDLLVKDFLVTFPANAGRDQLVLKAKEARYIPLGDDEKTTGGWLLIGADPIDPALAPKDQLEIRAPGRYFLRTTEVDFAKVTRQKNWWMFMSTADLFQELGKPDTLRMSSVAVLFHARLTRPFLGMILVLLGLSVILRDQNRNVFISAGLCLGLCALFFFTCFLCKYLGGHDHLSPALAAWMPVIVFGPLSWVMFDAVHT